MFPKWRNLKPPGPLSGWGMRNKIHVAFELPRARDEAAVGKTMGGGDQSSTPK